MNILIVDDEELIRSVIKEYLLTENYKTFEADNGIKALEVIKSNKIDLIILDIMMPDMDGFTTCKKIKEIKDIPVIMLSARKEEYDKLNGFDLGIDDYITKPFSPKELIARIKAVLKRKKEEDLFIYKDLKIDFLGHKVTIKNKEILLRPKEFELLTYLINNKGIAISRESLLSNVWNYDYYGDYRTIDTHIKTLRKNLKEYQDLIITVHGIGYKFEIQEKD